MNKILTLCLTILLVSNCLKAEQLLGVSITYRNIGNYKYLVTYKVYTDKSDTTAFKKLEFKVYSGTASVINMPRFIKTNTYKFGCKPDFEETFISTYQDTIDLNLPLYTSIKTSGDCRTYFTCKYPERYSNLKNIATNAYFSYAFINTCNAPSNTSPVFIDYNNLSNSIFCINKGYVIGLGASDTTNFDSIACYFSAPYNDFNSNINYEAGYTLTNQFDNFKPKGYIGPSIPESDPPIGIFLGSETGDLVFTPTMANSSYAATSEAIEYRKTGNKYVEVGGILSDFVLRTNECSANNNPILSGPYVYNVEAGKQICFTIISDDLPVLPNPPDEVKITWNREIPNATFSIIDPNAKNQSGQFCWIPKIDQVNPKPYTFSVTAYDNNCYTNIGRTTKQYSIKVNQPSNSISTSIPHNIIISPNPSSKGELTVSSDKFIFNAIALFDITGKQIEQWKFEHSEQFKKDLSHLAPGVYFIRCSNESEVFNFKWIRE